MASFLDARHEGGSWLVRIEDLDPPRAVPGSADGILRDLETLGMAWDSEVVYQSKRGHIYQEYLDQLSAKGLTYFCRCSRREIADSAVNGIDGPIYPGTCRGSNLSPNDGRNGNYSLRIDTRGHSIRFRDRCQGMIEVELEDEIGDFNLKRADGLWAYQFAVALDDALQGITQVVRGADLLYSTPRQIYLQQQLGLQVPEYLHHPVVLNRDGSKLSKSENSAPLTLRRASKSLWRALKFLAHPPPRALLGAPPQELLAWATEAWTPANFAGAENRPVDI